MKRSPSPRARKIVIGILLTMLGLIVLVQPKTPETTLVAKGGLAYEDWLVPESAVIENEARTIALADERIQSILSDDYGFLYAVPLGEGEVAAWGENGCRSGDCAQVTFYDYGAGGTVEAIVELTAEKVIAAWSNEQALPGASRHILPRAWAVASADPTVSAVIPNVRTAEPVMVPMSTWMLEGVCQDSWCVDLTFMAPDESGRVYHVLVDMENEEVAQTFYSRGLEERTNLRPAAQQISYNDGCQEEYGWSVCWEMTAHDGINFYDAEFIGRSVFSSAKISQVEVFYPAWPGGYRDEIGYGSSVPPYFGTNVTDLGEGFEVQQLYTEFLRWPNCICCYRYEQIMRFYADGRFEARFVSHGPGCDDDSIYRPFWRIDMDLGGPNSDAVWYWQDGQWQEGTTETRLDLFEDRSPDNQKLFTEGGGLRYYWEVVDTDPTGADEGRLFLLNFDEEEGVGPIATGPADTFFPPQGWVDEEPVSGENIVVWYVPLLNTRWEDPYWCVPDPDPDFSPCEAILRIVPGGELVVAPPIEVITAEETAAPTASQTAGPTATPRPIAGEDAASILLNAGCGACHRLNSVGLEGEIGPDLSNTAAWAGERIEELSAADYIRQSIVEPGAFIASDCPESPCRDGVMPANYRERLAEEQIEAIVEFLLQQGVETEQEADSGFSLPPAIGQNNLPLGTSSGGTGAQLEETADTRLLIIPLITFVIIFGLVVVQVRRRNGV